MRVTERESGQLLYLLTFTYNEMGQRETETRLFRDGTQMTISYTYNEGNQPATRTFSVKQPQNRQTRLNGSPLLFLGGLFTWLLRSSSRRRVLLASFAVGIAIPLGLSFINAQPSPNNGGTTQVYHYDAAGNLNSITIAGQDHICATYTYDNANRLVEVTQGDVTQTYAYDAFNRVISMGDQRLIYQGDTSTLLATVSADGTLRFHGQAGAIPDFFQTDGNTITWITNDGRQAILATTDSLENGATIRLFDPLGRFISFDPPEDEVVNPCQDAHLAGLPLADISPVQIAGDGLLWDAVTNLYFVVGRTYKPELGRFLQRDPKGPDAFGNLYDYPSRQTTPPVRDRSPAYMDGLIRLREAMTVVNLTEQMSAETILLSAMPVPPYQGIGSLPTTLRQISDAHYDDLTQQLDLPVWLTTQYNLPAPYLDGNNALRLSADHAPGHGGLGGDIIASTVRFDSGSDWLPEIAPAFVQLEQLMGLSAPPDQGFVLYDPEGWQPAPPRLDYVWAIESPGQQFDYAPNAAQEWLPQSLQHPALAADTLDAVLSLMALPNRTGETWLQAALAEAYPTPPTLPTADGDTWLQNWFTDDVLGVTQQLQARQPELPTIDVPVYGLGINAP